MVVSDLWQNKGLSMNKKQIEWDSYKHTHETAVQKTVPVILTPVQKVV